MPKVSVNIPCFNSAKFIKETIQSVLGQTYEDFEVIVMDDGSSDDTGRIVNSFADPRIRYFYKQNEGLSETRNEAIRASTGEYVAFLDHDDLWLPEKLEEQVAFFDSRKECGLIFSDTHVSKHGRTQAATYFDGCRPARGAVFGKLLLSDSNFIPILTVLMRRDIFDNIGYFRTEFSIGEEYELFLRAAERYEFDYMDKPLAVYRVHGDNFSNRKDLFVKEAFEILDGWRRARPEFYEKHKAGFLKKEAALLAQAADFYALNSQKGKAIENFDSSLEKYDNGKVRLKRMLLAMTGCGGYGLLNAMFGSTALGRLFNKEID